MTMDILAKYRIQIMITLFLIQSILLGISISEGRGWVAVYGLLWWLFTGALTFNSYHCECIKRRKNN